MKRKLLPLLLCLALLSSAQQQPPNPKADSLQVWKEKYEAERKARKRAQKAGALGIITGFIVAVVTGLVAQNNR